MPMPMLDNDDARFARERPSPTWRAQGTRARGSTDGSDAPACSDQEERTGGIGRQRRCPIQVNEATRCARPNLPVVHSSASGLAMAARRRCTVHSRQGAASRSGGYGISCRADTGSRAGSVRIGPSDSAVQPRCQLSSPGSSMSPSLFSSQERRCAWSTNTEPVSDCGPLGVALSV
jgi:hypothetical protein